MVQPDPDRLYSSAKNRRVECSLISYQGGRGANDTESKRERTGIESLIATAPPGGGRIRCLRQFARNLQQFAQNLKTLQILSRDLRRFASLLNTLGIFHGRRATGSRPPSAHRRLFRPEARRPPQRRPASF